MIMVKIKGGLGNQLFQYAFGRQMAARLETDMFLDLSWYNNPYFDRRYLLDNFNIHYNRHAAAFPAKRYAEQTTQFDESVLNLSGDVYFEGYWQSDRYFANISTILLSELTLRVPLNEQNQKTADLICQTENSVCIHVRHGRDILIQPEFVKVCSPSYYNSCIEYISRRFISPKFFVFSDDAGWAAFNLVHNPSLIFITQNDEHNAHLDLYLMSLCKHHIIPASTLSWWSAWQASKRNDGGIILRPDTFYNIMTNRNETDLFPPAWKVMYDA